MTTQNEIRRQGQQAGAHADSPGRFTGNDAALRPSVDIFETPDDITVQADMPGVSKDRLDIHVEGTSLFLEGRVGIEPQQQMAALYADLRGTTYRRSFLLGNELEVDKIQATLQDGVLVLKIPKRAEVRPRRIEVKG